MPDIRILTEAELRQAVVLDDDAVACVENAFRLLATKDVVMPPILSFHLAEYNGEVDVKTAYVPGIDSFAIKMSPGYFDNPKRGLPSVSGLMVVFAARTGMIESIHLDNGYLTDIRTAAAGAVAAKWCSRADSRVAGILGSGTQARLQLHALTLVRHIEEAVIWGRDPDRAETCADDCRQELGIDVRIGSIDDVMAAADIVVTTTPSKTPLIHGAQLRPGQHVTAMGTDAEDKTELAPDVIPAAGRYICDSLAQCRRQGDLRSAIAAGTVVADAVFPELGQVIAGRVPARASDDEITVCDLTGTGVQDTAIATLAYERAISAGAGSVISN